jgi:hypothetical protein
MEPSTRLSLIIEEAYIVISGKISHGLSFYGPFRSLQEAESFCGKRLPNETTEITTIKKETVVDG